MSYKKFSPDVVYKDTKIGETFTGKQITNSSFSHWKAQGKCSEWATFRKANSIEDYSNGRVGFVNPNTKYISDFVKNTGRSTVKSNNSNSMKIKNLEMGPVTGQEFKVTITGQVAIKTNDGYVTYDKESETLTDVSGFTMDQLDGMFYQMPTVDVVEGDLISSNGEYGYVVSTGKKKITIIDVNTGEERKITPRKSPFGMSFTTKIVSMFDMMNGDSNGTGMFGDMNPMMLMMMSGGDNKGGMFGGDMMQMMMMSNMMGNGSGNGMFGDMFGGKKSKKK